MDTLSEEERNAINFYTSEDMIDGITSYKGMNIISDKDDFALIQEFYEEQGKTISQETVDKFKHKNEIVSNALSKNQIDKNYKLFRKVNQTDPLYDLKNGDTGSFRNFLSTTTRSIDESIYSGGGTARKLFVIRAKKGTSGAYVASISDFSHEKEFLMNRGNQYKVTGTKGNVVYLDVW